MRKIILPLIAILIGSASFTACNKVDNTADVKTVDSLLILVDKSELLFKAINPTEVGAIIELVASDLDTVKAICEKKKIELEKEDAQFFGKYKALASAVKKFSPRYSGLKEELVLSKKQLNTLKSDIDNNLVDAEKKAIYLAEEKKAVGQMVQAIEALHGGVVYLKENVVAYRPEYNEKFKKISSGKGTSKK